MDYIKPMLAKAARLPINQANYGFEIKWDGIRALFYASNSVGCLISRNGLDLSRQYPEILPLSQTVDEIILDGEIVAFNDSNQPSFSKLQHRMGLKSATTIETIMQQIPVVYIIFDLLKINGNLLLDLPYKERRAQLELLELSGSNWKTPAYKLGEGDLLLAASQNLGLEGIVAKRLCSLYLPGKRSNDWLKIKNQQRQEFVIAGWVPGEGSRSGKIGSLLIGYYDKNKNLIYAGKVGTGFSVQTLTELSAMFDQLQLASNPFITIPPTKNAHYLKPVLVGEFEFTEWTPNNTLRHPSFKGLRFDKKASDVNKEPCI